MSDTPLPNYDKAPLLGEDTEEVLKGLGYTDAEIKELEETGIAKQGERK